MAASKEDYLQIVTAEETEIFILSLVEHVVVKSQDVLFEKHIESQVLPYAVQFAKGALDELVEWEFFRQDEGVIDPETWEPDEAKKIYTFPTSGTYTEPEPAACDSWSPGMIPIRKVPAAAPLPAASGPSPRAGIEYLAEQCHESSRVDHFIGVGIKKIYGAPAFTLFPTQTSRMELASAASLTASSASLGRKRYPSGGNSGRRGTPNKDGSSAAPAPLSATQVAEMAIQEENKRTLARLRSQEKDGGKPLEWSYDHNGRVVVVKKTGVGKQTTQSVKAKVVPAPQDAAAAAAAVISPSPGKLHAPGIPAAAEASHKTAPARDRGAAARNQASARPSVTAAGPFANPNRSGQDGQLVPAMLKTGKPPSEKAATTMPAGQEHRQPVHRQRKHPTHPTGAVNSNMPPATVHSSSLPVSHAPGRSSLHRRAKPPGAAAAAAAGSRTSLFDSSLEANTGFVEDLSLEVPSLAETMKLAAGVILRENDTIKRGAPPSYVPNTHPKHLPTTHPMPLVPRNAADPLAAVLARARPVIRRMIEPLPGIGEGRTVAAAVVPEKQELGSGVSAGH
ncbi:hypothetical protein HDU86_001310 [Geranomyces michiganensis]|nr:hypothetical protein HDU86_001310 [Geranomyces michiganensis]